MSLVVIALLERESCERIPKKLKALSKKPLQLDDPDLGEAAKCLNNFAFSLLRLEDLSIEMTNSLYGSLNAATSHVSFCKRTLFFHP